MEFNETKIDEEIADVLKSERETWTFSILGLFILTTIVALSLGLHAIVGLLVVPLVGFGVLFIVGNAAIAEGLAQPFRAAVIAILFCPYLGVHIGRFPMFEEEVVWSSFIFGFGSYLLFFAIRKGHWATQLLAFVAMLPYVIFVTSAIGLVVSLWPDYSMFWTQYLVQ